MRRVFSIMLALLASVGLTVGQVPVVHAHEDGHEAHSHDAAFVVHVALHDHPHEPCGHGFEGEEDELPGLPSGPGEVPETHAHFGDFADGVAPARGAGLASPDSTMAAGMVAAAASWCGVEPDDSGPVPRTGPPRPVPARALDRLVDLGRLLI